MLEIGAGAAMTKSKIAVAVALSLLALVVIGWASGLRIFVIQPIGAVPEGVTAIVMGVPGLRPIDSPDAFCYRNLGSVTLLCRGMIAGKVAEEGKIIVKLPYSGALYRLSGAPEVDG
jgi:hypothetical protein